MGQFKYLLKNDYDKRVKIKGENILCYSKSRLKSVNPELDKKSIYESGSYKSSEKSSKKHTVGEMQFGNKKVSVLEPSSNNSVLYKKVGYVCTENGEYVALCVSRIPFFVILFFLTAALVGLLILLFSMVGKNEPPIVTPDNPLPPVDIGLVPETGNGDETQKVSPEGGGAVSMIYTLAANVTLSTGDIKIHFRNPIESNHSVAIEFYIVSDGKEYLVAESGLVPSGNGLFTMKMSEGAPSLVEGTYEGLYRVKYYDPITGIRANVQSDITNVVVGVKP